MNFLTSLKSAQHIDCRILTLISPRREFSGICSSCNSNSRSTGFAGLNRCRRWLAALARLTGFGKLGQGSSVSSSIGTSLTIADAGLNKFVTASFFVFTVIRAAKPALNCPWWLCSVGPKTSSAGPFSTTLALQTLPYGEHKIQQSDYEANYSERAHNLMIARFASFQAWLLWSHFGWSYHVWSLQHSSCSLD